MIIIIIFNNFDIINGYKVNLMDSGKYLIFLIVIGYIVGGFIYDIVIYLKPRILSHFKAKWKDIRGKISVFFGIIGTTLMFKLFFSSFKNFYYSDKYLNSQLFIVILIILISSYNIFSSLFLFTSISIPLIFTILFSKLITIKFVGIYPLIFIFTSVVLGIIFVKIEDKIDHIIDLVLDTILNN